MFSVSLSLFVCGLRFQLTAVTYLYLPFEITPQSIAVVKSTCYLDLLRLVVILASTVFTVKLFFFHNLA